MEIALIGVGKIARDQHVPAIAASADWDLVATLSHEGTVDGVPAFTDLDELLQHCPGIGAVSLCVPPGARFSYAEAALKAGRHVMLEKPPSVTLAECHALERLARAHDVALFATWHSREAAMVSAAQSWLRDKPLRRLRIIWKEDVRRWHPGQDWVWEPGGLGVFDPGINALSILTEILPDAFHVSTAMLDIPENRQTPIAAALAFHHPAGAEVTAEFDWREAGPQRWDIIAETDAGTLALTHGGARLAIDGVPQSNATEVGEYPRLYAKMARLAAARAVDFDLSPLLHTADAFLRGERRSTAVFHW
ncbi:MAG: Gfo/Idh/MocA family oxidoreductase [Albidovulum sp.]|uniref:Gfo/Idh/MocA family protein n=1 Tax=Albidovulum sp. TaxID=1872424 RepID=UPI003C959A76